MSELEMVIEQADTQSEVDWDDFSFVEDLYADYNPLTD
jgi:hypothetical protein